MDPTPPQPRSISEIGHLFLSSVRDRGAGPRPVRVPPPRAQPEPAPVPATDELTPEEYAHVAESEADEAPEVSIPPVSALLVQHLGARAEQQAREYARHLAANGQRVGVMTVDAGELVIARFERSIEPNDAAEPVEITEHFDHRRVNEAITEMSCDLDRWLVALPNARLPEARSVLKEIDRWIVLGTCDHDGVVSCYRALKGLADLASPRLSLAMLDAPSEAVAQRVFRKLSNVCVQFLGIELETEEPVRPTRAVAEHVAIHCRLSHDQAQLAAGAQWLMLADFLARARACEALAGADSRPSPHRGAAADTVSVPPPDPAESALTDAPSIDRPVTPLRAGSLTLTESPMNSPAAMPPNTPASSPMTLTPRLADSDAPDEVVDLASDVVTDEAIVSAVLSRALGGLVQCPLRPPMCATASIAVTRERGLVLVAVAQKGLRELGAIAQAYRWLSENRSLIAMALPQFAIDTHSNPRLLLMVEHADVSAQVLAPMLQNGSVTVQSYRKLRWHGRTGLLLDAA